MKVFLRIVGVLLLLAAVAAGVWLYRNQNASAQTAAATGTYTQIIAAARGNLSSSITVVGQLDALQSADLTFDRLTDSTPLKTLSVSAGNSVKAGDALATVDPAEYQQAVDQARTDLETAQAALDELKTPATELENLQADQAIAEAEQQIAQAQADLADLQTPDPGAIKDLEYAVANAEDALKQAKVNQQVVEIDSTAKNVRDFQYAADWHDRKLNEYQQMVSAGTANKEQTEAVDTELEALSAARAGLANAQAQRRIAVETAAADIAAAEAALATAKQELAEAKQGGAELELAAARLAITEAETALIEAKDTRAQLDAGADATELAVAQAAVDQAKVALSDAETDLAATTIVAPFDGVILAVNYGEGDSVSAGTAVMTIADMSQLQVLASVDEITIRSVAAGQTASVTFDAVPGQTLTGVVGDIPLQGELQGDIMVYEVPVILSGGEDLPLLVGMTADVTISTGDAENALLVPTMALSKANGMYQVMVADPANPEAAAQSVPVQVGLSDGTYTQITAGLNEGDQVVVEFTSEDASEMMGFPGGGMMMLDSGGGGRPPDAPRSGGSAGGRGG